MHKLTHPDLSGEPTLADLAAAVDRARYKVKNAREAHTLADHKLDRCLAAYTIRMFSDSNNGIKEVANHEQQ